MYSIERIDENTGNSIIDCGISKREFDLLPEGIRTDLLRSEFIVESTDAEISFRFSNHEDSKKICSLVGKYESNEQYRKNKLWMRFTKSGGMYEDEDIVKIFEAQEGLCYYTRKPLINNPRNFEIDHIVPVADYGSSFPGNLALAIKQVNRDKRNYTRGSFLSSIADKYGGKDWLIEQRKFCRRVDARRKRIDDNRKRIVVDYINSVKSELRAMFPGANIDYSLDKQFDTLDLYVGATYVAFPAGFMRQKRLFASFDYVCGIVKSLLANHNGVEPAELNGPGSINPSNADIARWNHAHRHS